MPPGIQPTAALMAAYQRPTQSKKFLAFMFIQACWTGLLVLSIVMEQSDSVLLAMVTAAGTAQSAFLGFQAWHDKAVRTAVPSPSEAPTVTPEGVTGPGVVET